nr:thrombospondin type-1 domain-containing protein 7B [Parasteatoda tepidariorum]
MNEGKLEDLTFEMSLVLICFFLITGTKTRERGIIASPLNGGKPCPHLHEVDLCFKEDILEWHYGEWKECVIDNPRKTCGDGKRMRDKTCFKLGGKLLYSFNCEREVVSYDEEYCRIYCPNDCVLSEWSQWSACSAPCFTPEWDGWKSKNRTLIAVAGEGGKCTERMMEEEICNDRHCYPFIWRVEDWGSCLRKEDVNMKTVCGVGVQKRKVYCSKGSNATKTDGRCKVIPKPETERECHFPCPLDCVVSNFTDWTPCEPKCETDGVQKRRRIILQYPKYGGKACPDALEEARHCTESQQPDCLRWTLGRRSEPSYHWNISSWSECLLPVEKQPCGFGFQVRNVSCLDGYGRVVEPYFCLFDNFSLVPTALRSCEVTCSSKECVLTIWSPWSECKYTYKSKRSRHRELVGESAYVNDCEIKFKLTEEEECPVITEAMLFNNNDDAKWMSCIVEESNKTEVLINGEIRKLDCGEGYRYKRGLQINKEHGVEPGLEKDLCLVDCPLDCKVTAWTPWSPCSVPCGKGFIERRRNVLLPANSLGRPCPNGENKDEIQKDVCHIVCADYYWLADSWSNCSLTNDSFCGNGMHYRLVRCLNKWSDEEVPESKCDPLLKPVELEPCRLHCPGECVLSPWKISKKCSEPCSRENYEEKTRWVMRYPNSTAEPCPHLISRSPCVWNENCFNHSFVMGSWGSCVLPEGSMCGEGVQKKPLMCMRSDGRQVDAVQCEKNQRSPSLLEPISKPCYIDCPADCVLSEWSEWKESSCYACGNPGFATRTRSVIQLPSDDGQPCSPELEQRKPCSFKACYHWKRSSWSPCNLESADCGYGLRHRVVECVRYDGLVVDKMNCLTVNLTFSITSWLDSSWLSLSSDDSHEEEICHVPCPGDCIMTEWTPWSHCQKNCRVGQIVGYRTSSRKVLFAPDYTVDSSCPTLLQKTKPCWSDDCNFFRWRLLNNSLTCEGKDGIIVEGGCVSVPLPCEHWCQKLGGRCDSLSGLCYCDNGDGYTTILEQHSHVPCKNILNGPHPPANHSAPTQVKYYPDDSQVSFWMYAMISIGTAFVIFVAITVYMMCRSSLRQRPTSVERQPSVRRRTNLAPPETNNCPNANSIVHNRDYE